MAFSPIAYGIKTFSMYGGAGGQGTRISTPRRGSLYGSSWNIGLADGVNFHIMDNEKTTMQNLNDRLASYIQKVHSLEEKNIELEKNIREWYANRTVNLCDRSDVFATIKDLRDQIEHMTKCNAKIFLEIDNARLAAEDFKMRYETELNMRMVLETEMASLRKVLDEMSLARAVIETHYEGLKEELIMLGKNHEEEVALLHTQTEVEVNVSVDAAPSMDLNRALSDIREHYEGVALKNQSDLEAWYKSKVYTVKHEVMTQSEDLQFSRTELKELRGIFQRLQIELPAHKNMRMSTEGSLVETQDRYSAQLTDLQRTISDLEHTLHQIHTNISHNKQEYETLLNLKACLEAEITEYMFLLEGKESEAETVCEEIKEVETLANQEVLEDNQTVPTD